jgi:hypothetical protein
VGEALRSYGRSSQDSRPEPRESGRAQAPASPQLAAELRASCKPNRGLSQVNKQLASAEVAVLGQAPADRGLRNQHRQTELGRVLARVRSPARLIPAP